MLKYLDNSELSRIIAIKTNFNTFLTMSKEVYANIFKYKTDIELLQKIVKLYSVMMLDDDLENHEEKVLMFYLKYEYSPETKQKIIKSLGITASYLNTINYHLDRKGYLIKDENNKQKKHLSDGLKKLKEAWVDKKSELYVIKPVKV